jgi:hypothetical protein
VGVEAVEGRGYEPNEAARLYVSTIGVKKYIVAKLQAIWQQQISTTD